MRSPKMTRKWSFSGRCSLGFGVGVTLVVLSMLWTGRSISAAESMPDWLAAASRTELGSFGNGTAAIVIGDWTNFTVDASGKFTKTERRALKVLNRRAAGPYLAAEGEENTDQKVTSIKTWTVAPSGRVTTSGKKDLITTAGFSSFEEFSDVRVKMILPPEAEDGSLIGSEVVTEGRFLIGGERFQMEDAIPVHLAELHVSAPSGSLRFFLNHPDRVQVVSQAANEASFRTENRSGISDEPDAPPFTSLAAFVFLNYDPKGPSALKSWEEAGHSYHTLFDLGQKPENEISSEVEGLSAGTSDELAKIDALYTYVSRQIRYVAIEIGIGGYQPHYPADVYKNKYGDCKDKATLLISMLNKIGLRGYPALVGTRNDVEADPAAPTLATFDHMIVALPVPENLRRAAENFPAYDAKNQILWLDPTSEFDPLGQVPEMDQGVFALIAYPDHGDLERIPEPAPAQNGADYTVKIRLQADGTGSADVDAKYSGNSNARRHAFYRGRSQADILKAFEERVGRYVNQPSFRQASIAGAEDSRQQVAERFSFAGNFTSASTGNGWILQPLVFGGVAVPDLTSRSRQLPLDVGAPHHVNIEYRIELPPGMRIERLPEKISAKSEFGDVEIEYAMSGETVVVKQMVSLTASRIPPEKFPAFRDFVNSYLRATRQGVRIVSATP